MKHEPPPRRIAGCVCPACAGSGRPVDAEPPHEPWVLLFDRCPDCEGTGAGREESLADFPELAPHPRMIAPRTLIEANARVGMVGEIIDGVSHRRACVIDSSFRREATYG